MHCFPFASAFAPLRLASIRRWRRRPATALLPCLLMLVSVTPGFAQSTPSVQAPPKIDRTWT
ncbi:MAG: hypothetical protein WB822_18605, partial [Rhodoplanes sp.]